MKFVSTRFITADVPRLVAFYEKVTGTAAVWANELFAEIPTPVGTLAIGSDKTVALFGAGSAEPAANRSARAANQSRTTAISLPSRYGAISGRPSPLQNRPGSNQFVRFSVWIRPISS
jgi:catechol 2,3-dioxygenase-like lactoylglutathione lyase family enzyme